MLWELELRELPELPSAEARKSNENCAEFYYVCRPFRDPTFALNFSNKGYVTLTKFDPNDQNFYFSLKTVDTEAWHLSAENAQKANSPTTETLKERTNSPATSSHSITFTFKRPNCKCDFHKSKNLASDSDGEEGNSGANSDSGSDWTINEGSLYNDNRRAGAGEPEPEYDEWLSVNDDIGEETQYGSGDDGEDGGGDEQEGIALENDSDQGESASNDSFEWQYEAIIWD